MIFYYNINDLFDILDSDDVDMIVVGLIYNSECFKWVCIGFVYYFVL